jgi:hypothetical protein
VLPISQNGTTTLNNLALACFHCNRRKSNKTAVIDPVSELEVPLFNPRRDAWGNHFIWSPDTMMIIGLTPTGRATIVALELNRTWVVSFRAADHSVGRHPPIGDSILKD